jgi:hypothetical protein
MYAGAFQAHEHSIRYRSPLRIVCTTIHAFLQNRSSPTHGAKVTATVSVKPTWQRKQQRREASTAKLATESHSQHDKETETRAHCCQTCPAAARRCLQASHVPWYKLTQLPPVSEAPSLVFLGEDTAHRHTHSIHCDATEACNKLSGDQRVDEPCARHQQTQSPAKRQHQPQTATHAYTTGFVTGAERQDGNSKYRMTGCKSRMANVARSSKVLSHQILSFNADSCTPPELHNQTAIPSVTQIQ